MSIETRLAKLEALKLRLVNTTQPLNICVFGVGNNTPDGYACGDVLIFRDPNESIEDLKNRCSESIACPESTHLNFFEPF